MKLKGSCHCRAVTFTVDSHTPYPFNRCYCSICRKTAGAGGYAINIMGEAKTLKVTGARHVGIYYARLGRGRHSAHGRRFCKKCGSPLWVWSKEYADWVYPFASAIDTALPKPGARVHLMLDFKAPWIDLPKPSRRDRHFALYPDESIAGWHKKRRLWID